MCSRRQYQEVLAIKPKDNNMNKRRQVIRSLCVAFAAQHVHSFQLQSHPHRLLTQCNVGYQYPQNWSDIKPNNNEQAKEQSIVASSSKKRPLSPLGSLWTKYSMIAYVAHMCAFLPLGWRDGDTYLRMERWRYLLASSPIISMLTIVIYLVNNCLHWCVLR